MGLKPDLVIVDDVRKEAFVIDVAMPFEGTGTFAEARAAKKVWASQDPPQIPRLQASGSRRLHCGTLGKLRPRQRPSAAQACGGEKLL